MFSTKEQLETTVDCLINKICELNMTIKTLDNKCKSFDEVLENYQKEKSKIREFEERIFNLEMENGKLKKENKELEEKCKTKNEVKEVMENLKGGLKNGRN